MLGRIENEKRNNLIIVCLVVIIIAGSGILYKNYFTNIDSNNYLSSKMSLRKVFSIIVVVVIVTKMRKVLILKDSMASGP